MTQPTVEKTEPKQSERIDPASIDYRALLKDFLKVAKAAMGNPHEEATIIGKFDLKDMISEVQHILRASDI